MIRKILSFGMVGALLFSASSRSVIAGPKTDDSVEKVRSDVRKLGSGSGTKVVVKMKNGRKVEGRVSQVLDDSFDVVVIKTRQTATILFGDVSSVKRQGWSKGSKIAIGVGIAAAVTFAVIAGGMRRKGLGGFCPISCSPILRP